MDAKLKRGRLQDPTVGRKRLDIRSKGICILVLFPVSLGVGVGVGVNVGHSVLFVIVVSEYDLWGPAASFAAATAVFEVIERVDIERVVRGLPWH